MLQEAHKHDSGNCITATDKRGTKPMSGEELVSRRSHDRRKFGIATLVYGNVYYCRRRDARRLCDTDTCYVDWYEPRLLYITLGVLILSCVDAVMTLNLLQHGSIELNPFMGLLIETNIGLFVYTKLMLTGVGLVFLVMHVNFRLFRYIKIRHCLNASLVVYLTLVGYEVILLSHVFLPEGGILPSF